MGGFFGAVSREDCVMDVFFGVDYHSHLGTRRAGMIVYDRENGFERQIHNIENTPFRTKFEKDLHMFRGCSGIGCISDTDPQPLLVRSHLGLYGITTVGIINNAEDLIERCFTSHGIAADRAGERLGGLLVADGLHGDALGPYGGLSDIWALFCCIC